MKRRREENSIRFLALRALIVTILVLLLLTGLQHLGITVKERDVPAPVVEEAVREN